MANIAIIGGGAAGVSALYQLVEVIVKQKGKNLKQQSETYKIYLIEKSDTIGPGLAYSTKSHAHILNLPYYKMSPVPDRPDHFKHWLQNPDNLAKWRDEFPELDITKLEYPPRRLFGIYLKDLARETQEKAMANGIQVEFIHDEAIDIQPVKENNKVEQKIILQKQQPISVDKTILCVGHLPPSQTGYEQFKKNPQYYPSPWEMDQTTIPIAEDIIVLGTRLSAIDFILEREEYIQAQIAQGYTGRVGKITAVSRTGLPPRVIGPIEPNYQRRFLTLETLKHATDDRTKLISFDVLKNMFEMELKNAYREINKEEFNLPVRAILDQALAMNAQNWLEYEIERVKKNIIRPWQTVLFSLYPIVPNLWEALNEEGKKVFLDDFYSFWMTNLAAFPIENAEKILNLQKNNQLEMIGKLGNCSYNAETGQFAAEIEGREEPVSAKYLINATGQAHDIVQAEAPLLQNLQQQGLIIPHPLGGIDVKFKNLQARGNIKGFPLHVIGDPNWGAFMATADLWQIVNQIKKVVNSIMGLGKKVYGMFAYSSPYSSPGKVYSPDRRSSLDSAGNESPDRTTDDSPKVPKAAY